MSASSLAAFDGPAALFPPAPTAHTPPLPRLRLNACEQKQTATLQQLGTFLGSLYGGSLLNGLVDILHARIANAQLFPSASVRVCGRAWTLRPRTALVVGAFFVNFTSSQSCIFMFIFRTGHGYSVFNSLLISFGGRALSQYDI